jgi:uncharacterized protein (TIGR00725 family)
VSGPPYVAVCGPGDATEEEERWAEEVGRGLGKAGAVLVCGGLGGVMEAAARGASEAGGVTVGLLPNDERAGANRFLTVALALGLGEARNALIVRAADAVVAVSGEWGTLSEIALALKMGKPVIGLETWRVSKGQDEVEGIRRASTPAEAVELALRAGGT